MEKQPGKGDRGRLKRPCGPEHPSKKAPISDKEIDLQLRHCRYGRLLVNTVNHCNNCNKLGIIAMSSELTLVASAVSLPESGLAAGI